METNFFTVARSRRLQALAALPQGKNVVRPEFDTRTSPAATPTEPLENKVATSPKIKASA